MEGGIDGKVIRTRGKVVGLESFIRDFHGSHL